MKQGDFTELAKNYIYRTGYSLRVLKALAAYMGAYQEGFELAEIGAGTGKLTENLVSMGFSVTAVEPNDAMREEGQRNFEGEPRVQWFKGSGEVTGLENSSCDWLFMASSFHWTDPEQSLPEFHRVLKPGGYFTALWNPRNLESSALHQEIENRVYELAPQVKRVSSGSKKYTQGLEDTLLSGGHFQGLLFMEAPHEVVMSKERYMGAWRSVNDIRAQAGEEKFVEILQAIEEIIAPLEEIRVPYKTRAWTVQKQG